MYRKLIKLGLVACLPLLALTGACASPATLPEIPGEGGTPTAPKPEEVEVSDMTEKVIAEVILRSADGSSILDAEEGITAKNIEKYRVGKEVIEEATKKLEGLGFEVVQTGPVGFTISGDKALFESMFQTTLEARSTEIMPTKIAGVQASYYEATAPIKIPEELSSLVADVALPTPPEFFP